MNTTENNKVDVKKILSTVGNVLIWAFVILSLAVTAMVFAAQKSEDGVPALFGKSLITIQTKSMEDTYYAGDMVFMTKINMTERQNLEPGTIITFRAPIDIDGDGKIGDLNTHRIVEKKEGTNSYITKGDNNVLNDDQGDNPYTVHSSDIIGVCTDNGKIRGLGNVIKFLSSSLGFFLCIVLPLILFFLYELYRFITILVSEKQKKAEDKAIESEEDIKRRAIEEYLAAQAAANATPAEEGAASEDNA